MNKSFAIAAAFALSALCSGCATFSRGTLASELANDHEPGSLSSTTLGTAGLDVQRGTQLEGSVCTYGTQCRSGYCSNNVCENPNGHAEDTLSGALAVSNSR